MHKYFFGTKLNLNLVWKITYERAMSFYSEAARFVVVGYQLGTKWVTFLLCFPFILWDKLGSQSATDYFMQVLILLHLDVYWHSWYSLVLSDIRQHSPTYDYHIKKVWMTIRSPMYTCPTPNWDGIPLKI